MNKPNYAVTESSSNLTRSERLKRLAKLFPMRRLMPRSIFLIGLCFVLAFVLFAFIAGFVSDQAAEIISFWIDRITKNIF